MEVTEEGVEACVNTRMPSTRPNLGSLLLPNMAKYVTFGDDGARIYDSKPMELKQRKYNPEGETTPLCVACEYEKLNTNVRKSALFHFINTPMCFNKLTPCTNGC